MVFLSEPWKEFFQTLGIILAVILGLILIAIIVFPFLKKKYESKYFKEIYYKTINQIALDYDFLLINNLTLRDRNGKICSIDHLLFAEKYIYVIRDRYYRGAISGNLEDNVWYFYGKEGKKEEMENPMIKNKERMNKLSKAIHFDENYFVSIVLINNNALVKNLKDLNKEKDSYFISISKLKKLIKTLEGREVPPIDQKSLESAVLKIAELKTRIIDEEID